MPTAEPTDTELEKLGRAEAARLGASLQGKQFLDWTGLPDIIRQTFCDMYGDPDLYDNERDAYIALARAVLACREACGYDGAVKAERERAAKIAVYYLRDKVRVNHGGISDDETLQQNNEGIAAAIRRGTP
jgi:hypothetical protein